MASLVGVMAGTLSGGNITAAESTSAGIIMETEAIAELCKMIGFRPPPAPADPDYDTRVGEPFAWAHLTSGGTAANIEALWAARTVRYLPLAVHAIAAEHDLSITIRLGRTRVDIADQKSEDLLAMDSRISVTLPYRLADALLKSGRHHTIAAARKHAGELLSGKNASPSTMAKQHPPVVFAPGTAHYSIDKAADVCGIGRGNLVFVDVNSSFRMDVDDLKHKYRSAVQHGDVPIAVIGVVGTTEEGAVDPIDEIINFRDDCERHGDPSFWVHADAAWGGYFASLFRASPLEAACRWAAHRTAVIDPRLEMTPGGTERWISDFLSVVRRCRADIDAAYAARPNDPTVDAAQLEAVSIDHYLPSCGDPRLDEQQRCYALGRVARWLVDWAHAPSEGAAPYATEGETRSWLASEPYMRSPDLARTLPDEWGDKHGKRAHLRQQISALHKVDSATVDPHKMGYLAYPAGAILFQLDEVRDILTQQAPYIQLPGDHGSGNNGGSNTAVRAPLYYRDQERTRRLDSPALWTLEGSRPAAAAASLWASVDALPLDRRGYGNLIKTSIESADRLAQLLNEYSHDHPEADFHFVVIPRHPDSNIVNFIVRPGGLGIPSTLPDTATLTEQTMRNCTILNNEGIWDKVENRSAILSKTEFHPPKYPRAAVDATLAAASISTDGYDEHGLTVLRAVVANPYLPNSAPPDEMAQEWIAWDPLQQFVAAVADAATRRN